MIPRGGLLLGALALAVLPGAATGQSLRGQVVDRASGRPVAHGFVVVQDTAGSEVARALADDQGRFFVKAPSAGTFRLQSRRIGFRAAVSPAVTLGPGELRDFRFEVEAIPIRLPAVVTSATPRCGTPEGAVVGELWEEIREALAAVSWTSRLPHQYELTLYERDLDQAGRFVSRERTRRRTGRFETPFKSASPQRLARDGYLVREGRSRVFYGPDVDVVRSRWFVETHCFAAVASAEKDTTVVGLSFDPVPRHTVTDLSGVLWVDRSTGELRRLEFRYVNLPQDLRDAPLGGAVEFLSLPAGGWIVRDWRIRTPLLGWVETFTQRELRLIGLQETGGRVMSIAAGGRSIYAAHLATLTGSVLDEGRDAPLPGARIELSGTPYQSVADAAGRFTLVGSMDGEYQLTFAHPRLDSLAYTPKPVDISLRPGEMVSVGLLVPPESVILARLCPDSATLPSRHVIHGTVRDGTSGSPLPDAEVQVLWQEITNLRPGQPLAIEGRIRPLVLRENGAAAVTDSLGHYVVCGVPTDKRATVTVVSGERVHSAGTLTFDDDGVWVGDRWHALAGRVWRYDLTVAGPWSPK